LGLRLGCGILLVGGFDESKEVREGLHPAGKFIVLLAKSFK
jgi:hypothetical protein